MRKLIPLICLILLIPVVGATELTVTPEMVDLSLFGGESREFNAILLWTGEASTVVYPDFSLPEGLSVEVESPIVLTPNVQKTVPVKLSALPNLVGNFTVTFGFSASVEEIVRTADTVYIEYTSTDWFENTTRLNETIGELEELQEEYYKLFVNMTDIINLTQAQIDALNEQWQETLSIVINETRKNMEKEAEKERIGYLLIIGALACGLVVCVLAVRWYYVWTEK